MVEAKMFNKSNKTVPLKKVDLHDDKKCDISSDEDKFDSEPSLDLTT